jgi:hypothetical protein
MARVSITLVFDSVSESLFGNANNLDWWQSRLQLVDSNEYFRNDDGDLGDDLQCETGDDGYHGLSNVENIVAVARNGKFLAGDEDEFEEKETESQVPKRPDATNQVTRIAFDVLGAFHNTYANLGRSQWEDALRGHGNLLEPDERLLSVRVDGELTIPPEE